MINFIGIGAQKSGTSWVYACLYEHPQICAPIKEIHFFSRDRFSKGKEWYESHFKKCNRGKVKGEFSTSYLYSEDAPQRVQEMYPEVKLIAILRNPIERAYSQYRNAIKAGEIEDGISFSAYAEKEPSVLGQGLYAKQLKRYLEYFRRDQMLVLIYEDSKKDPEKFIKTIYTFLGVDASFIPSMLNREINVARAPRAILLEKAMHRIAESLRTIGFDRLVHVIRRSGIPDLVRVLNTKQTIMHMDEQSNLYTKEMKAYFRGDTQELSRLLDRDIAFTWRLHV